ncbi:MAG: single-stranded DNA-binding protein [Pseudonocardia sp.]
MFSYGCATGRFVHLVGSCPQLRGTVFSCPTPAGNARSGRRIEHPGEKDMGRNETVTTIVGNIASTVGKRTLTDGTVVASFRLASSERRWNKAEGAWGDGDRLFLTVTCWRELGENVVRSFVSGDPVVVFGRLRTHRYERDGNPSSRIEMEAIAVGPDLNRCSAVVTRSPRAAAPDEAPGPDATSRLGIGEAPVEAAVGG